MHTPFIIGPFGDDCPRGWCPCPEWIESLTTAREIRNLRGRDAFLMPSSALQCFDIIVQCPGPFQNHAAMAVGRGRWFMSCYIDPDYMDAEEWRFFAGLMRWARHHRAFMQEPMPIGGDPAERQAYGYVFRGAQRILCCLRNPWIEEAAFDLAEADGSPFDPADRVVRTLYPRREVLGWAAADQALPEVELGPYETVFVEIVPAASDGIKATVRQAPDVTWRASAEGAVERLEFEDEPPAFGPDWTSPLGDIDGTTLFRATGALTLGSVRSAELCVLCEGGREVAVSHARVLVDGEDAPLDASCSVGAFAATGAQAEENWKWFMTPLEPGEHTLEVQVDTALSAARFGVFLRGMVDATASQPAYDDGPPFPLYRAGERPWSRTLIAMVDAGGDAVKRIARPIEHIDGVYLDTLQWRESSTGWGEVHRNRTVMGKRMCMADRAYHRGIGTHAPSRIVYDL
ncbi:MAG TPA: hypothetical protein ENN80_06185, partial [Candidatus Hydrogenedentes bacterium]|nr:hypothetical protein [Candidatus Hydrogenedentota bacterium]